MAKHASFLFAIALVAALTALIPVSARAATGNAALPSGFGDPVTMPAGRVALSHFSTRPGPARLHNVSSHVTLHIPLAATTRVSSTVLDLHYTNSVALIRARSILTVGFNGTILAQIHLDPTQPDGDMRVRLPAGLWRAGYNRLTISATLHYTDKCEDSQAPELWTDLDLARSYLTYHIAPLARPVRLSDLSALFSPGLGGQTAVRLLTAPGRAAESIRAQALPYVAQALALDRRFAPLAVHQANWRPGRPPAPSSLGAVQVVVGTARQLAGIMPAKDVPAIGGPKVAIADLGGGRARLIVTGRTEAEVITAARDLSLMQTRLTPDSQAAFGAPSGAAAPLPLAGRDTMVGGRTYQFRTLGQGTATILGAGHRTVRIDLPLPADFYTAETARARISLNFAYGAGMGPGSVINASINGKYIDGIVLNNPDGAQFTGYRLFVPARLLVPGDNRLVFAINSHQQPVGGACFSLKGRHLVVQILGTSSIRLPRAGHAAILPDLTRFTAGGFPYVSPAGQAAGKIYISSPKLLGSALTLIGKIGQMVGGTVSDWRIETGIPPHLHGRAIVLATVGDLDSDRLRGWATALERTKEWPYRALRDLRAASQQPRIQLGDLASTLLGEADTASATPFAQHLTQTSGLGDLGILVSSRNPFDDGNRTLTVFAADTVPLLKARMADLIQPSLWGQIRGDFVAWRNGTDTPFTTQVARHYVVGKGDPLLMLRLTMSADPWVWLGVAAAVGLLVALIAHLLLRRRHKRLSGEDE